MRMHMQDNCCETEVTVTAVFVLLSQAAAASSTTAGGTANQQQAPPAAAAAAATVRPISLLQRQRSVNLHNTTATVGNSSSVNSTNSSSIVSSVLNSAYNWLYPPPEVSALELAANSLKSQPVTPSDHHDSAERGDILPLVARNAADSNSGAVTGTAAVTQVKKSYVISVESNKECISSTS
jgi:hypothetical protein